MHHRSSDNCRRAVALVLAFGLMATACGDDAPGPEVVEAADDTTTTVADSTTTTAEVAASTASTTSTTEAATTTEEEIVDEGEFPGEPLDFGPQPGTGLAIVGVAYDDELNFRDGPSTSADVITSFGPLNNDLDMAAVGESWAAPSGVWWKVNVDGDEAWANQSFLGSLGSTVNAFDDVGAELGVLKFENVEAAALAVAETRASTDPVSRIVFVGEPLAFDDVGFAVVDVLDLGDDSVKGERIRIDVEVVFDEASGEEGAQDIAFVVVNDVEITPICGRGTSGGLCV